MSNENSDQTKIVTQQKPDIVRGFIGGSIQYRNPHDYVINDKPVHVDFAFVVIEDGKKKPISRNALQEIHKLMEDDPELVAFLDNLPTVKSFTAQD